MALNDARPAVVRAITFDDGRFRQHDLKLRVAIPCERHIGCAPNVEQDNPLVAVGGSHPDARTALCRILAHRLAERGAVPLVG